MITFGSMVRRFDRGILLEADYCISLNSLPVCAIIVSPVAYSHTSLSAAISAVPTDDLHSPCHYSLSLHDVSIHHDYKCLISLSCIDTKRIWAQPAMACPGSNCLSLDR